MPCLVCCSPVRPRIETDLRAGASLVTLWRRYLIALIQLRLHRDSHMAP